MSMAFPRMFGHSTNWLSSSLSPVLNQQQPQREFWGFQRGFPIKTLKSLYDLWQAHNRSKTHKRLKDSTQQQNKTKNIRKGGKKKRGKKRNVTIRNKQKHTQKQKKNQTNKKGKTNTNKNKTLYRNEHKRHQMWTLTLLCWLSHYVLWGPRCGC